MNEWVNYKLFCRLNQSIYFYIKIEFFLIYWFPVFSDTVKLRIIRK